ncbi:TPA: hypothetical protein SMR47_000630 [Pseudomonas putida]|nr:hypothetical protein [Pseudomonas putida]
MNFEGFMYLDIEHPVVAWNTYRGVLLSQSLIAKCNPSGAFLSMSLARVLIDKDWRRLRFEQILEEFRQRNFPGNTSRLTGLFVFDTPESALAVADNEAWGGKDGHIRDENLTDVGVSAESNRTRLDANWISWMLRLREDGNDLWLTGINHYWSGTPCPHYDFPIWEVLVDGAVTIWGTELRRRAYQLSIDRAPLSASLLEISRIAASVGSDLGHISALVSLEGEHQLVSFFIDMQDAYDSLFLTSVEEYVKANPDQINRRDLAVGGDIFKLPDFIAYTYVIGS